jgi:hypothetical protein
MICIINNRIIALLSDEVFKKFKKPLAIALPSILLSQPELMKLNNITLLPTTELS